MEIEIIIGFFIALIVLGFSIFIVNKATFFPNVQLNSPEVRCPDFDPELDQDNFNYYLQAAGSGCTFNATWKFHPSDEFLQDQARILGLVDKQGDPVVLKTETCEIPFPALILCNGTHFPGDRVEFSGNVGVVIRKLGR